MRGDGGVDQLSGEQRDQSEDQFMLHAPSDLVPTITGSRQPY